MASPANEELYIPRRSQRPVGLGGAVLRALAVMALLDVAFMLVARDEEPQTPAAAAAEEAEPSRIDAIAALPGEASAATVTNEVASAPPVKPAEASGAGAASPIAAAPETAAAPAPPAIAALPQPIPAASTVPSPPAVAPPAALDAAIVLPSSKPRPPVAVPHAKPARRATPHAHRVREPTLRRASLVEAAAPQTIEPQPPPCKPYTAETTLAGETRPVRGIACPEPDGTWRIVTERASLD